MRIAVIVSGTLRDPENSLSSIDMLRQRHDVFTFGYLWRSVPAADSFSKRENIEPSVYWIERFKFEVCGVAAWPLMREKFEGDLQRWKMARPDIPAGTNNIGMHGMYFSLREAASPVLDRVERFDGMVRLRTDCRLFSDPFAATSERGWSIPEGNDFFGLNDQLGWFRCYGDSVLSKREASVYFDLYTDLESIILGGSIHGPEVVLKANFDRNRVSMHRPKFAYSIH